MNADTKEVIDRMLKEKAKITKMITAEVAQTVKNMSDYDANELVTEKAIKKTKKSSKLKYLGLSVLLFLLLSNQFVVSPI